MIHSISSLIRRHFGSTSSNLHRKRSASSNRLLFVESLEHRRVLATLNVDVNDAACDAAGPVYCEIQQAEDVASPGDVIRVEPGTYMPVVVDVDDITIRGKGNPVVDATGATTGININASDVTIKRIVSENANDHGFRVNGDNNKLQSTIARNNGLDGYLLDGGSSDNLLEKNTAENNVRNGFNVFETGSNDNVLKKNSARDNGANGFRCHNNTGNKFIKNNSEDNTDEGYFLDECSTSKLDKNVANSNGGFGFYLLNSDGNMLSKNTAFDNGFAGILLESSDSNTLKHNSATDNAGEGFLLVGSSSNLLQKNTAADNVASSGFYLDALSDNNTLKKNKSNDNGGFGYEIFTLLATFNGNMCSGNASGGANVPGVCP